MNRDVNKFRDGHRCGRREGDGREADGESQIAAIREENLGTIMYRERELTEAQG